LRAATAVLVVETARLLLGSRGAAVPELPERPEVTRARRLLDERYGEPWRLTDLAAGSGLSAGHLAELFARDVGLPPQRYLAERRLERAAELLAGSDLPVTAIALEVGFGSGPHFSRVFREHMHCSPREYRRRFRAASAADGER
jgi:transcriptional regulator GlxA family with amidase domain